MADSSDILVALATYNERETLPSLVSSIHEHLPQADVLVIDDNSPDGTGLWCNEFSEDADWFRCEHRSAKLGLGSALILAMQTAIQEEYQVLVTLDADWSHPPDRLPGLVEAVGQADVAVGSRYCQHGSIEGWSWKRRFASRTINLVSRWVVGLPVRDSSGNYRAYRTDVLRKLSWDDFSASGYAYLEEVIWYLQQLGATFAEVPILFSDRRAGSSKMALSELVGKASMIVKLTVRRLLGGKKKGTSDKTQ